MDEVIINTIQELENEFSENELAYLALTQKIETPFRNRWAFNLHNTLMPEFIVSREWHRTDLAILTEYKKPKALIELKAMYSFDAFNTALNKFSMRMKSDESKARKIATEATTIYTVLLATHPKSFIPDKFTQNEIKYAEDINRCLKIFESPQEIQTKVFENVGSQMKDRKNISKGVIHGGEAFNIKTDILFWIFKA